MLINVCLFVNLVSFSFHEFPDYTRRICAFCINLHLKRIVIIQKKTLKNNFNPPINTTLCNFISIYNTYYVCLNAYHWIRNDRD